MRTLVLIPAYNEEKNLERVIENLKKKAPQFDYIIINDGSTDHTEELCRKKQYHYISLPVNLGLTGAMQTGMKYAKEKNYDMAIQFDADGQHSVDDLERVLEPLIAGRAEAVIGVRSLKDMPKSKNFGNSVMNILTHIFYGVNVSDSQTGFRALTRSALDKISINAQGYLISSEFIREINDNNIPFEEVTIETIYTPETQAKGTNYKVGIKILFTMIRHKLFD